MISARDILLGLAVMTVWAGNTIAIKYITLEVPPFIGLSLRMVLATLIFLPFFRWVGRDKFPALLQVCVLMAILHWGSLIWAIERLDASMAAILMQMQVVFAVLIGRFFFRETFGWRTIAGITISIAGIAILVGLPENPPSILGVIGMAFSMLALAMSYARMKAMHGVSSINYIAHLHVIGIIPAIALMLMFERPMQVKWAELNHTALGMTLLYQALVMSASHMLWQRLIHRSALSGMPNLTLLLPVLGVTFAWIFLGETITPTMIAGGALTTFGVGVILMRRQKKLKY